MIIYSSILLDSARFLHALNDYSNLLLAIITSIYVVFSWRTLKALQRESFREHRLKHLEDIKVSVVEEALTWLSGAEQTLSGRDPLIRVFNVQVPRVGAPVGESAYDRCRTLEPTLREAVVLKTQLFLHARAIHFPMQLAGFESYANDVLRFGTDSAAFARNLANKLAIAAPMKRKQLFDYDEGDVADADLFVETTLRDLLLRQPIQIRFSKTDRHQVFTVTDAFAARPLCRGTEEIAKPWAEAALNIIEEDWRGSGLVQQRDKLVTRCTEVRRILESLNLTYDLPEDCEYIGANRKS